MVGNTSSLAWWYELWSTNITNIWIDLTFVTSFFIPLAFWSFLWCSYVEGSFRTWGKLYAKSTCLSRCAKRGKIVAARHCCCVFHQWMVTSALFKCVKLMRHTKLDWRLVEGGCLEKYGFGCGWNFVMVHWCAQVLVTVSNAVYLHLISLMYCSF